MTVVSAVITKHCTAHATDSLLTVLKADGKWEIVEDEEPKLSYVKHRRGVMTFWGLALCGQWSTLDWLRKQVEGANKYGSAEEFASGVATDLNAALGKLHLQKPVDRGI